MTDFNKAIRDLEKLDFKGMFGDDFFLTWEKSEDELKAVWAVADALRALHLNATFRQKCSTAVSVSPCSAITLPVLVSPLLRLVTC